MYSLVNLSWTTLFGNLYLSCYWNIYVYLTAFAIFTLFLPPAIHAFQAVSKEFPLSQNMAYLCLHPHCSWLPITFSVAQTLTQHPQKPVWLNSILPVRPHLLPLFLHSAWLANASPPVYPLEWPWRFLKIQMHATYPSPMSSTYPRVGPGIDRFKDSQMTQWSKVKNL